MLKRKEDSSLEEVEFFKNKLEIVTPSLLICVIDIL